MSVDSFGYRIDGEDAAYGLFSTHTEEAVKEAGGSYALRFSITAPLFDLTVGAHTLTFLARLADGTECSLLPALTVVVEGFVTDISIPFHSSLTHINGPGPNGGAGIYVKLSRDTLTVVIKGLNPLASYRIKNYEYSYKVTGSELTLADDGRTVYILVDGTEITRITLSGEVEYPEHFSSVSPSVRFAERATIVMSNGQTSTVHNTLVASTCFAQCGAAVRGGSLAFTELTILPFSEAKIPSS